MSVLMKGQRSKGNRVPKKEKEALTEMLFKDKSKFLDENVSSRGEKFLVTL